MNDREIYTLWTSKTSDLRYLRPRRWNYIKQFILKNNIKSVIEFGSGVSTLLFANLNLDVLSLETDLHYMDFVRSLCSPKVIFKSWNNKYLCLQGSFDLSLVDGILPRAPQIKYAVEFSKFIIVDDCRVKPGQLVNPILANYIVDLDGLPLTIHTPKE